MSIFHSSSPVPPKKFIGRDFEIKQCVLGLRSCKYGNGENFIVHGKKGIGKTSFVQFVTQLAISKESSSFSQSFNFITINIIVKKQVTLIDLLNHILIEIKQLEYNFIKGLTQKVKDFLKKLELKYDSPFGTVTVGSEKDKETESSLYFSKKFVYDTFRELLEKTIESNFDGLLFILDEANNLNDLPDIGIFFQELIKEINKGSSQNNLMILLSGISKEKPNWLGNSRNKNFIELKKLTSAEIINGINNKYMFDRLKGDWIDSECANILCAYSKGHPYLFQKFGHYLELSSMENDMNMDYFIWEIFNSIRFSTDLITKFVDEDFLQPQDSSYIIEVVNKVLERTFNSLAPGYTLKKSKFWSIYYLNPDKVYIWCQNQILKYWLDFKNDIDSSINNQFSLNYKLLKSTTISNWLKDDKSDFSNRIAEFIFTEAKSVMFSYSSYYFCKKGFDSTNSIANVFLEDSYPESENAKIVWLKIVRICEYLVPLAKLVDPFLELNNSLKNVLQVDDDEIIDHYKMEVKEFDKLPKRICKIGNLLKSFVAFENVIQTNL